MEAKKHRLWIVRWRDAHGIKHESNRDETLKAHKAAVYVSAGILVQSDAVGVTITQDVGLPLADDEELTYRTRTFIPRELVVDEWDCGPAIRRPHTRKPTDLSDPQSPALPYSEDTTGSADSH